MHQLYTLSRCALLLSVFLIHNAFPILSEIKIPLSHSIDDKTKKTLEDTTNALNKASTIIDGFTKTANQIGQDTNKQIAAVSEKMDAWMKQFDKNWKETLVKGGDAADRLLKTIEVAIGKIDPELVTELKNVLTLFSQAPSGTFENAIVNIWDHATNMVALKMVGCIVTAAGFGTLYQWLGSLKTGDGPAWVNHLKRIIIKETVEQDDSDTNKTLDEDPNGKNERTDHSKKKSGTMIKQAHRLRAALAMALPPVVGTIFAVAGIALILRAQQVSAMFVSTSASH